MQRRATMGRSQRPRTRATMNTSIIVLLCSVVGSTFGYYVQREAPYNIGPNDPYPVEVSPYLLEEPSQRLFWSNGQGSNQVGGQGWWATLTNKFPFLQGMFGRLQGPSAQYGVPSQTLSTNYGVPNDIPSQYGVPSQIHTQYGVPARYQPQYQQTLPYFRQSPQFSPSGRDVGFTDDAVIVTPPHVPILPPQPAPAPAPIPSPEPAPGYQYNKPQYRLELPHK